MNKTLRPDDEPGKLYFGVEYDLSYAGGNYGGAGDIVYIPYDDLDNSDDAVEKAFEKKTGHARLHIVSYDIDNPCDAEGEYADENICEHCGEGYDTGAAERAGVPKGYCCLHCRNADEGKRCRRKCKFCEDK
jgi:hypothetical protein